jgi:hypothetical protein
VQNIFRSFIDKEEIKIAVAEEEVEGEKKIFCNLNLCIFEMFHCCNMMLMGKFTIG